MTSSDVSPRRCNLVNSTFTYSPLNSPASLRRQVHLSALRKAVQLLAPKRRVSPLIIGDGTTETANGYHNISDSLPTLCQRPSSLGSVSGCDYRMSCLQRCSAPSSPTCTSLRQSNASNRHRIQDLFDCDSTSHDYCYSAPDSPRSETLSSPSLSERYSHGESRDGGQQKMHHRENQFRQSNRLKHFENAEASSSFYKKFSYPEAQYEASTGSSYQLPPPPYPISPCETTTSCSANNCVFKSGADITKEYEYNAATFDCGRNGVFQTTSTSQEIREVGLSRQEGEPYGIRVEAIGKSFYITHLIRNSAATSAGLKVGDELIRVNNHDLAGCDVSQVLEFIREAKLQMNLVYKPRTFVERVREVSLQKCNGVLGLRVKRRSGALYIDYVKSETPASNAGLKEGDQVLKIDDDDVTDCSAESIMSFLKSVSEDRVLMLWVREKLPLAHIDDYYPPHLIGKQTLNETEGETETGTHSDSIHVTYSRQATENTSLVIDHDFKRQ